MRKIVLLTLGLALIAIGTAYGLWAEKRPVAHYLSDLRSELVTNQGTPSERGNLLGIQPQLFPGDYQSPARLRLKLAAYLRHARELGLLNDKTIAVLPEHIGTWLMLVGEKPELYLAATTSEAMHWLAISNPLLFVQAMARAEGDKRLDDARLRMKAASMAQDYQALFGGLAREFGVTLVAGSIVLPEPSVEQGILHIGRGPLYNSALVFGRDGRIIGQPQRQRLSDFPGRGPQALAARQPLQVFQTPAGPLGVLIGRDSWYPANYQQLRQMGAQMIVVSAALSGKDRWQQPWRGYRRLPWPAQVTLAPGSLSEAQAWQQLARLDGLHPGISVFLRGRFWDNDQDGQSFAHGSVLADQPAAAPAAQLLNVWL